MLRASQLMECGLHLQSEVLSALKVGDVVLGGDFNAWVGTLPDSPDHPARGCTHHATNPHGKKLVQLCRDTGMVLCTGRAPGDEAAAATYTRHYRDERDPSLSRLDHILVPAHLLPQVIMSRVHHRSREESDHFPLEATLVLNTECPPGEGEGGEKVRRRVWRSACQKGYLQALNSPQVQALLLQAREAAEHGEVQVAFGSLIKGVREAADTCGMQERTRGRRRHIAHSPWFDAECSRAKDEWLCTRGADCRKRLRRQYSNLCSFKKRAHHVQEMEALIKQMHSDPRAFWAHLKGHKDSLPIALQAPHMWDAYMKDLAGCPGSTSTLPEEYYPEHPLQPAFTLNVDISIPEVQRVFETAKGSKAQGPRGLPTELFSHAKSPSLRGVVCPNVLVETVRDVFNAAFQSGQLPQELKESLITPVFKKGDPLSTAQYRPIAVIEPLLKLYTSLLNTRLSAFTESRGLRAETQAGFRAQLSPTHQIFALEHILQQSKCNGTAMYACFIDLKGAYDRVDRGLLWVVLERLGVHGQMLAALKSLYVDCDMCIKVNGCRGRAVRSLAGLKQGCPLSPLLFGLFIDGLHRCLACKCPDEGFELGSGGRVRDLGYADDFVLLADSPRGLQALIDAAHGFCEGVGQVISAKKSKVVVFCSKARRRKLPELAFNVAGHELKVVSQFKYLGLVFDACYDAQGWFQDIEGKMWAAWRKLESQFKVLGHRANMDVRLRAFSACVPAIASYGCEVWSLSSGCKGALRKISKLHMKLLKYTLGTRPSVPECLLWRETCLQPLAYHWLIQTAGFHNRLRSMESGNILTGILEQDIRNSSHAILKHRKASWVTKLTTALVEAQCHHEILRDVDITHLRQQLSKTLAATWHQSITDPEASTRLKTYADSFDPHLGSTFRQHLTIRAPGPCQKSFIRFRLGCHNLPVDLGSRSHTPLEQRVCKKCAQGAVGDEHHLIFDCPTIKPLRERYRALFTDMTHASLRAFMFQSNSRDVVQFVHYALRLYYSLKSCQQVRTSGCPDGLCSDAPPLSMPGLCG